MTSDREWILRAARGEIDTPAAKSQVAAMLVSVDQWKDGDPEAFEALQEGNRRHPERVNDQRPTWERDWAVDVDAQAAFDRIVATDGVVEAEARELRLLHEAGAIMDSIQTPNGADTRDTRDTRRSGVTSVTTVPWESPSPLTRSSTLPVFPVEVFPAWMRDHVEATAEFTQTPVDLPAVVALSTLATAVGGRIEVRVRGPWIEPTNLFTVTSLPPGSRKSAVFSAMTRPIYQAEQMLAGGAEPKIAEAETMLDITKAKLDLAKKQAAKADTTTDEERHKDESRRLLDELNKMMEAELPRPRLVCDDATPEAAAALLGQQRGRLRVLSAEGGIFSILAGRYSSGVPNLDLFLKGHAGDELRIDRKNAAPVILNRPALTLGLTVQPDVLKAISDMPGFRGRGLLARILYSVPVNTVGYRRCGVEPPASEIANRYEARLRTLACQMYGVVDTGKDALDDAITVADEPPEFEPLTLSDEAAKLLLDAERTIEPRLRPDWDLGYLADWASKLIGEIARIAGLLHTAEHLGGVALPISGGTMQSAIDIGEYFTQHAIAAFDDMGADASIAGAKLILAWIKSHDIESFTRRDAHRGCRTFRKATDLDPCLDLLEHHGYVQARDVTPEGGGHRTTTYTVNPMVGETR